MATITAIILAHYTEREHNLSRMIDDLLAGTVKPAEIVVFVDNPAIKFDDTRATIIRSTAPFLPKIRFALGSYFDTDYCFFIDDDLSVRKKTLENFMGVAAIYKDSILGLEGSILGNTPTPYANDTSIDRGQVGEPTVVDIVIRNYFAPVKSLTAGLRLQAMHPELPRKSLDDVYLCMGDRYLNGNKSFVIPVDQDSDLIELGEAGVGQSLQGEHYANRNQVCRALLDIYG